MLTATTTAKEVLKHLRRAGHDRLGEFHKVYPRPGEWDIEFDTPGCEHGLWFRPDGKLDGDEGTEDEDTRVQCEKCTCGYSDTLAALERLERLAGS